MALKIPLGHLVDLFWRHKALFVYLDAILMVASDNRFDCTTDDSYAHQFMETPPIGRKRGTFIERFKNGFNRFRK